MRRAMAGNERNCEMLTTSDVARLLNIHVNTVRRWSNQRIMKAYRIGPRGDRRFHREDMLASLLGWEIPSEWQEKGLSLFGGVNKGINSD